ncbi:hypothetical protein FZX09_03990 [Synechococcus sp. MU1643]|uniref:hypothetical protein n=1 Tax=Synechococcus sp. MU1643 TaxID=2508349 RepID=UPI001CF9135B|nr:hypothetical protein [Synechococcus sp. MU1643]MCB4427974.1 hypothetical protein [Synechococcus sp. MU1643]
MSKRQPKAVYEEARRLHRQGMSINAIAFQVPLTIPQIRRAVDPEWAKQQAAYYAKRQAIRRNASK